MKTFAGNILITGTLVMSASALMGQSNNAWLDQWCRAKYGRSSPATEARQRAEQANTTFREDDSTQVAPSNVWREQWYKAKYGRYSPMEEARLRTERESTAFREEPTREIDGIATPRNSWLEQWYKAKFGRPSPMEEARQTGRD